MAKMTGKGLTPDIIFGGTAEIDRMDVAAACSRLPKLEYYLLRVKYCNDVSSVPGAVSMLEEHISGSRSVLADLSQPTRAVMASLMLQEIVTENRCRQCKGVGTILKRNESINTCTRCEGTGRRQPSALSRAKACKIPESTWRHKRLGEAFDQSISQLEVIEASALASVARRVS